MTPVSTCPKCGAPIYMPTGGSGTQLPIAQHTCMCRFEAHPSKDLTDEEILDICPPNHSDMMNEAYTIEFARAILRKAQEADNIESLGTVNIGGVHFRNGKEVK